MQPKVDMDFVVDYLVKLLTTPSPSGHTDEVMAMVEEAFAAVGSGETGGSGRAGGDAGGALEIRRTNKGGLIATLRGADDENQRLLSAHVDTLGGMVKEIKASGRLKYVPIGGASPHSVEGEYCPILTDDGRRHTGTILTIKAAAHVYGREAQDQLPRKEENMEIRLDEKVKTAAETRALGIEVGNFIAFDPRTEVTPAGFIKSRHLDDKASVAVLVGVAKALVEAGVRPAATTHFFITNFEEVGHGASYGVPPETKEYIAVDMGVVGDGIQADEYCVSICAKDSSGPYDEGLKRRLVELAKANAIPHAVDIYPYYGSDASAALRAGADIRAIVIGQGVDASHAYERTHREGIKATADLLVAYLVS